MKRSNREIACHFLYLIHTATEISGIHVVYANCLHWAQPDLMFCYYFLINLRVYLAFFTDFFPLCSLPSFAECWWEVKAYLLCGKALYYWHKLCKLCFQTIHQLFLTTSPHTWQNQPSAVSPHSGSPRVTEALSEINMRKLKNMQ